MRVPVQLFDYATKEPAEGELFDEVTVEHFLETQRDWRPAVIEATKAMLKSGAPRESIPRHFHWDWGTKESELRVLAFSFFGISCGGKLCRPHEARNCGVLMPVAKAEKESHSRMSIISGRLLGTSGR